MVGIDVLSNFPRFNVLLALPGRESSRVGD
jgi:hypothetical protein